VEIWLPFNHRVWGGSSGGGYGRGVARRRRHATSGAAPVDPFAVLGLPPGSTVEDVENARRTLAKSSHPDVGGSVRQMQVINAAADEAARLAAQRGSSPVGRRPPSPVPTPPAPSSSGSASSGSASGAAFHWRVDHPSFTVEALPAESFEALLVVASWLGETIDDDPPYRLDVELVEPVPCWCRLELLPDAGATSVGLTVGSERGVTAGDVDAVRDAWIAALNALDWEEMGDRGGIGDSRQRP
jgi:hypothetical protein